MQALGHKRVFVDTKLYPAYVPSMKGICSGKRQYQSHQYFLGDFNHPLTDEMTFYVCTLQGYVTKIVMIALIVVFQHHRWLQFDQPR